MHASYSLSVSLLLHTRSDDTCAAMIQDIWARVLLCLLGRETAGTRPRYARAMIQAMTRAMSRNDDTRAATFLVPSKKRTPNSEKTNAKRKCQRAVIGRGGGGEHDKSMVPTCARMCKGNPDFLGCKTPLLLTDGPRNFSTSNFQVLRRVSRLFNLQLPSFVRWKLNFTFQLPTSYLLGWVGWIG